MKSSLFIPLLLVLLAPLAAEASSSVLLPNSSGATTNPYVPGTSTTSNQTKPSDTPAPATPSQPAPTDTKPAQAQSLPATPLPIPGFAGGQTKLNANVPQVVVPPEQLQGLIQMEKQFDANTSQNMAIQKQMMMATGQTKGMTDKQIDDMLIQQAQAQSAARQKRIKALQSGNVSLNDLMSLYNGK